MPIINLVPIKTKQIRDRVTDEDYKLRQDIYQTDRWKKLRLSQLINQPLCECCLLQDIIKPAIDVHHLISFTGYKGSMKYSIAYDPRNLASLCKECHQLIHHNKDFRDLYTSKLQVKRDSEREIQR